VSLPEIVLLVLAGVGGGTAGSVAGLASLVSYPALLAVGISPVTANVTNTVALVFSSIGSVHGSRPELTGQAAAIKRFGVVGVLGGAAGGALLLLTPESSFERVVPWLIAFGSVVILLPRRTQPPGERGRRHAVATIGAVFLIAVYAGYFGAAAGVLMFALMLVVTGQSAARSNALKNAVLGLANGVAAVAFIFAGHVRWAAAVPLAIGFLVGGRLGPSIVRRLPATVLRVLIALGGIGLAGYLAVQAY
jgi:uncharacterized membrane protein YfcA